ncbi:DUF2867 domain-containing protein [Streptomyces sindenensis]|uniref:DUF2867 domain-containing protein n=1 Tax=Streptomyces sindenensis TaxID=67363 RepID=UPI001675CEA7|nr:DUF2867 domain-containing protein [Streptomyces sindenensis]GGP81924.1 hypothetical protein GCM10010231_61090 [Streptomyces sindenensis]
MTRLPDRVHTERPWRVHELTGDFRVEDVWAVRTPGAGPDDFPTLLTAMQASAGPAKDPLSSRFLFAVRRRIGALLGWDKPLTGAGDPVPSLRGRLPRDLREAPGRSDAGLAPLASLYELDDECALERATTTVHAVIHLGLAPDGSGGHELRMAVLVKPNGLRGRLYMAAIAPFRRLVVFPALVRQREQAWRDRGRPGAEGGGGLAVGRAVGTHEIPGPIRALSSLSRIDYADVFTLSTDATAGTDADTNVGAGTGATAELWARALFGDVPDPVERLIWRGLLGLRLSRGRSPGTVAGWRIAERGEDWIRLEAASWFLTGNLVVRAADGQVSLGTFLRYDRRLARAVWPPLSAVHRRLAPGLLRDAAATVRAA